MKFIKFFLFYFLILFLSCNDQSRIKYEKGKNKNIFEKISISFLPQIELHTDTFFNYESISNFYTFSKNEQEQVVVLNGDQIYEFDLTASGNILKTTTYPLEGPNAVKGTHNFNGIVKLKEDDYLLLHHPTRQIYRIEEGRASVTFGLEENSTTTFYNSPFVFPIQAANDNDILIPLMLHPILTNFSKSLAFGKYNVETNTFKEVVAFPKSYAQYHWGNHPYVYLPNIQYIPEQEQYFVSFPIESDVHIYDVDFNYLGKEPVKSEFISEIKPFLNRKLTEKEPVDYKKDRAYIGELSYYLGAFWDPTSQKYMRLVSHSFKNDQGESDYRYTIIVCTPELEVIDEITLDAQYNIFQSFSCSKGFMILNEQKMEQEGQLPFDRFKVD